MMSNQKSIKEHYVYSLEADNDRLEDENKRLRKMVEELEEENKQYQEALIHIINESYSYDPSIAKMSIIAVEALENS